MPRAAQRLAQLPLVGGQPLEHPEAPRERRLERRVGGEVGDAVAEHPGAIGAGEVADQAGADHRAVGLVEVVAERADGGVLAVGGGRELGRALAADHEGRAPDARACDGALPDGELDDVAVDRDPLGLRAGGDDVAVGARAELHADGQAIGQPEGEVEARGVVRGIRESTRRAPGRGAAGRVEPGAVDAAEGHVLGAGVQHARPWGTASG